MPKGENFFTRMSKQDRFTVVTCFIAFFVNGMLALMMGSIMPMMRAKYLLSESQGGMLLSAHSIGNMIIGFVAGIIPLYIGRKNSIVLFSSMICLGFLMMIIGGNFIWLFIGFTLTGMGRGSISNFNNGTVARVSGNNGFAMNILHSFFAIGALCAPFLVIALSGTDGMAWKLAVGVLIALAAFVVFRFTRVRLDDDRPSRKERHNSSLAFMKNRSFIVLCLLMFFYLCMETAINGWLVSYLFETGIMSANMSQVLTSLLWASILVGRLVLGWLSNRVSVRTILLCSSAGALVFFFLMVSTQSSAFVTVCILGLGFCLSCVSPLTNAQAGVFFPHYPMAVGMLLLTGSLGAILMPTVVGFVAGSYGFAGGMSTIVVAAVLMMVCSALNLFLRPVPPVAKDAGAQTGDA